MALSQRTLPLRAARGCLPCTQSRRGSQRGPLTHAQKGKQRERTTQLGNTLESAAVASTFAVVLAAPFAFAVLHATAAERASEVAALSQDSFWQSALITCVCDAPLHPNDTPTLLLHHADMAAYVRFSISVALGFVITIWRPVGVFFKRWWSAAFLIGLLAVSVWGTKITLVSMLGMKSM